MIRQFLCALAFLTRIPVASNMAFNAQDVAQSARWFPIVGALIGGLSAAGFLLFQRIFPPLLTATLLVTIGALVTGALHLDGLADTADGFGAGRTREETLRIMRDHAVGSYGAVALVLVLAVKIVAIATLVERPGAWRYLILAPALGRWSSVLLSAALPYARQAEEGPSKGAVAGLIGRAEFFVSTASVIVIAAAVGGWPALVFCAAAAVVATLWGLFSKHRIGGITGDTLGAAIEISEVTTLLVAVALR